MTSFEFDRAEFESLASKLDSLRAQLSERERALLLAIFSGARIDVSIHIPAESSHHPEPTVAGLQQQILDAFIPGVGNEVLIAFRIGPSQLKPPPPPPPPPGDGDPDDSPSSDEPPDQT